MTQEKYIKYLEDRLNKYQEEYGELPVDFETVDFETVDFNDLSPIEKDLYNSLWNSNEKITNI